MVNAIHEEKPEGQPEPHYEPSTAEVRDVAPRKRKKKAVRYSPHPDFLKLLEENKSNLACNVSLSFALRKPELTEKAFAEVAGITVETLQAIKAGKGNPTLKQLTGLIAACKVRSILDLFRKCS